MGKTGPAKRVARLRADFDVLPLAASIRERIESNIGIELEGHAWFQIALAMNLLRFREEAEAWPTMNELDRLITKLETARAAISDSCANPVGLNVLFGAFADEILAFDDRLEAELKHARTRRAALSETDLSYREYQRAAIWMIADAVKDKVAFETPKIVGKHELKPFQRLVQALLRPVPEAQNEDADEAFAQWLHRQVRS